MRCALMMIRLSAAWRKISVSRTTGMTPEAMMSASTWPGPDRRQLVDIADKDQRRSSGIALSSACISGTSTIEVSSTTSRSQSSG